MIVAFRWPWMPSPEPHDPTFARREAEALARWRMACDDMRRALQEADEFVKAEQEDPDGV